MSKVTFICDEAASLGANMNCIDDAIQQGRGFGLNLQLYYQSRGQLRLCFPKDGGTTLLSNVTQIYAGTSDSETAEEISKRLGDYTAVVESGGIGYGNSSQRGGMGAHCHYGRSANENNNWNQVARRLLKPEEIMTLPDRVAITFVQGLPPIFSRLERYYETRIGPPRFQGIKTVLGTIFMLALGTFWAVAVTSFIERFGQ